MYNFRLTEEISRWAFEIVCKESPDWYIAFTNPTAGPWKTIKGLKQSGEEGEVYRFELNETRPDIVLVNDRQIIVIIEAKDSIKKLANENQAEKSIEVVNNLTSILKKCGSNPCWGKRSCYPVLTGILWGAKAPTSALERADAFHLYRQHMLSYPQLDKRILLGIETRKKGNGLQCFFCCESYEEIPTISPDDIRISLGLPLI